MRIAKVFDLRHLKYTIFDNTPWKYDDWAFSFKWAIRSANCDAYKLLTHVEREVRAWKAFPHRFTACCVKRARGTHCLTFVRFDDMHRLTAWQQVYKKYNPKTVARATRLVGAATHHLKVKELKHVEAAMTSERSKARS